MRRSIWLGIVIAIWSAPLTAQAPIEGVYQSTTREVGSTLVLAPDGRFLWVFAYGALDLAGEGRWTRAADGSVTLDSVPAVTPPRFELVSRGRDAEPGVAVRLACDTGDVQFLLNVLFERSDGQHVPARFQNFAIRMGADEIGGLTGVRLFSETLNIVSDPFPVDPAQANILTFRLIPNDLGRADFRGQRLAIANGVLTLDYQGMPIRYRREASAAGQEIPALPPTARPAREVDGAPFALDLALFEDASALKARVGAALTDNDSLLVATAPIDLRLSYEGRSIDLGRIEGVARPLIVQIDGTMDDSRPDHVGGYTFSVAPQTLEAALAQAQALKAWLEQVGFAVLPSADNDRRPPFEVTGAEPAGGNPTDWASAARVLADEAEGVTEMSLFTLRTPERGAEVRIENARRIARERCAHAEWPDGGRDWRIAVELSRTLAPVGE